jgi:hypothetical protein
MPMYVMSSSAFLSFSFRLVISVPVFDIIQVIHAVGPTAEPIILSIILINCQSGRAKANPRNRSTLREAC